MSCRHALFLTRTQPVSDRSMQDVPAPDWQIVHTMPPGKAGAHTYIPEQQVRCCSMEAAVLSNPAPHPSLAAAPGMCNRQEPRKCTYARLQACAAQPHCCFRPKAECQNVRRLGGVGWWIGPPLPLGPPPFALAHSTPLPFLSSLTDAPPLPTKLLSKSIGTRAGPVAPPSPVPPSPPPDPACLQCVLLFKKGSTCKAGLRVIVNGTCARRMMNTQCREGFGTSGAAHCPP